MSIINKGTAFSNGEQLTADKLNDLVDLATFDQSATDSASTTVNTSGQIVVADSGVSTAKIAANAVTTAKILDANVTKAKIEDVADYKVLGNVSGTAAAPAEVSILDEDDMTSDSATALATQQSIKAYVDTTAGPTVGFTPTATAGDTKSITLPNGLIMKFGRVSASGSTKTTVNFSDFGGNFTNNVFSVVLTPESSSSSSSNPARLNEQPTTSSFVIRNLLGTVNVNFVAIGR